MASKDTVVGRISPDYNERRTEDETLAGSRNNINLCSAQCHFGSLWSSRRGGGSRESSGEVQARALFPLQSVISEAAPGHRPGDLLPFPFSACSENEFIR